MMRRCIVRSLLHVVNFKFSAPAWPIRPGLRLLLLLEQEELSVAELQDIMGMGQSRISSHLAQLKRAGVVTDRRAGKNVYYGLTQTNAQGATQQAKVSRTHSRHSRANCRKPRATAPR